MDIEVSFEPGKGSEGYIDFQGNVHQEVIDRLKQLKPEGSEFKMDLTPPETFRVFSVNLQSARGKIQVVLPKGTRLDELSLSSYSSDLEVSSGTAKKMKISSLSGHIKLNDITADELILNNHSGDISGAGITAGVKAKTLSGGIDLKQLEGESRLESHSGSVELTLKGVSSIDVKTLSGDVDIIPDPGFDGFYEATTLSGDITTPKSPKESKHTIKVDTHSGNIDIDPAK
ncbi:DUF4097 family beta strand repeat-containing protein [Paenibacillus sp. DMB20]|uniref:DUF4097 family beta strand repeat-containing protein n=1 Tax=Paenibacillus sp. DMB20 TaxID=1642570 RepID=UPI0006999301|nr:DUF4097 family beta strand repeat-containing protein [Paenibacillus sp. DMB20]